MRKYSILIVDDEENVHNLLSKVLFKNGYATFTASNAVSALKIIHENNIDIVISDIKMPDVTGIELLEKIKKIDSSIKVIMITAFATLETAIEALRKGASDYITKPFNLEEILLSIQKLIGNEPNEEDEENKEYLKTNSTAMKKVVKLISTVADAKTTVMIYGETGTGKELAARALHDLSSRKDMAFIKVNCAAIPESLLESELFGYEKGAFTGAMSKKPGRFELANGGSIFLDEIGDITPSLQVKLLRVLQEREFERLGGITTIDVDVRIIAATNKDLKSMVKEGTFREDLYYRLNVIPINMPPLRDRREDIDTLVEDFLIKSSSISGKPVKKLSKEAKEVLMNYDWPGNIRELENIIERCVVVTTSDLIDVDDLPEYISNEEAEKIYTSEKLENAVDHIEKDMIIKALSECNGNRTNASKILGISRRSLHRKILKYNIK